MSNSPTSADEQNEPVTTDVRVTPFGIVRGVLKSMRPHQWVKNAFVLAPVVFSLNVDSPEHLIRATIATAAFCFISGAVYLLNDILDVEADRAHPVKRMRPIARGQVPIALARFFCAGFCVLSLAVLYAIDIGAAGVALTYFVINVAYSIRLKHTAFVDVTIIALGFLLRILAGSLAIDVPVSTWLVSCTFLLALYLALGKRRHELKTATSGSKQRKVLESYDPGHVHATMMAVGVATVAAYTAYTLAPATQTQFGFDWPRLAVTVPFTAFGVWRFHYLANSESSLASPTEQMLRDSWFLANIGAWVVVVLLTVYVV